MYHEAIWIQHERYLSHKVSSTLVSMTSKEMTDLEELRQQGLQRQ